MKSLLFLLFILILGFKFYSVEFLVTLLVISFLIFFHELGHFLAAKSLGVKVEIFSIGFGKSLIEKEFKGTNYRLSALPLGGYVKLKGQDDFNPKEQNYEKDSYGVLSPLKKIYILFAGPFFNLFLAFLLYIIIAHLGVQKPAPQVGSVAADSAALHAGIQNGDRILAINGVEISSFDEISKLVKNEPLTLLVKRGEQILSFSLTPKIGMSYNEFLQPIQKPLIGISPSKEIVTLHYLGLHSLKYAYEESINASTLILKGIIKLVSGDIEAKNLGGVITMVDVTSKAAMIGISTLLIITALISVNLGILNLLPIPMLDGGHIMFNLYELIFKRKVSNKTFEYLSYTGMALLFTLMLFATFNDIMRFIQ